MSKQAILHIGGEKTGTTTLQRFLTNNARALRRAGYYYPSEKNNICFDNKGHFPVAGCMLDTPVEFVSSKKRSTLPLVLQSLKRLSADSDDSLILSCEHFSSRLTEAKQLRALRDALSRDDIKIIFYAREASELVLAAWSTWVKGGVRDKLDLDSVVPTNRYFNHLLVLDLWSEVFGRENLIVREYSRVNLVEGDIRHDFCEALGIKLKNPRLDEDENRSLDAQRLEVLRHLNEILPMFEECASGWEHAQDIRHLVTACIPAGAPLTALMSNADRAMIKARFADANRELSERYLGGQLSRKWFAPDDASTPDNHASSREQAELVDVLRDTIVRLAEITHRHQSRRPSRKVKAWWRTVRQKFRSGTAGYPAFR